MEISHTTSCKTPGDDDFFLHMLLLLLLGTAILASRLKKGPQWKEVEGSVADSVNSRVSEMSLGCLDSENDSSRKSSAAARPPEFQMEIKVV